MLSEGTVINDRYRVGRLLGEGGMGAVFEGEHLGVRRRVAIKVLHPSMVSNPEIVERFEREAQAAAEIGHDNIIDVIDCGRHEGQPYMVMEFLKGESLGARLTNEHRMTVGAASYVMSQMLSALGAAHAAGIIHRDLKPDNVYLTGRSGVKDFVKLLDFGISKFKSDRPETKGLTQTGAMMGTPYYMAPEQALAKRDIDPRADIYSAGVMLYQMTTGELPFEAESQAELLMAIVYGQPPMRSPREIHGEISPEFEAVILRAMARERDARYATADEFLAALQPYVEAPPPGSAESTGRYRMPAQPVPTPTPTAWEQSSAPKAPTPGPSVDSIAAVRDSLESPAPAKSRRGMVLAIGGLVALVAAVGIGLSLHGNGGSQQASGHVVSAPPPVTPPPVTPPPSADVQIDLAGVPDGATITLDEAPATTHLTLPRGSTHTLRVVSAGHAPFETRIVAERDREIAIALQDEAAPPVQPVPPTVAVVEIPSRAAGHHDHRHGSAAAAVGEPVHEAPTRPNAGGTRANPLTISNEF